MRPSLIIFAAVRSASSQGQVNNARPVIGQHLTQEPRVRTVVDDGASAVDRNDPRRAARHSAKS